jgi:hypothetical protein
MLARSATRPLRAKEAPWHFGGLLAYVTHFSPISQEMTINAIMGVASKLYGARGDMKQKMSQWPAVSVRVPPEVFARIEAESESRTLPASVIIREALARAFVQKAA